MEKTWIGLDAWLGKKESRPTGERGTRIHRNADGSIAVRYHETDVVTHYSDGRVVLDSGGWHTLTTRSRMNEYQSAGHVWTMKGIMRVGTRLYTESALFADGMTIHADGRIEGALESDAEIVALRKRVKVYAAGFAKAWNAGEVAEPSGGDCWYCGMREVKTDKPLGECFKDRDHVLGHMDEGYFVPSLLINAMEATGTSRAHKSAVIERMKGITGGWADMRGGWEKDTAKAIRKYVARQVGAGEMR